VLFVGLAVAATGRGGFHFAVEAAPYSAAPLHVVLGSVTSPPAPLHHLLKILFHESELVLHSVPFFLGPGSLLLLAVALLLERLAY